MIYSHSALQNTTNTLGNELCSDWEDSGIFENNWLLSQGVKPDDGICGN